MGPIRSFLASHALHRALGRFAVVFLCAIFILVRPLTHFGGAYPFLILTFKELVFSVQDGLSQQLEITVLNYLGALSGIAFSNLGVYLTVLANRNVGIDSPVSRAIPALFLTFVTFFAGLVRSRLPRLHLAARIACFISIWILTSALDLTNMTSMYATEFLWITAVPALISLFASAIFLRTLSSSFVICVNEALSLSKTIMMRSIERHLLNLPTESEDGDEEQTKLQESLLACSDELGSAYSKAAFEFRISRFDVKQIKPFIGIAEHIRRDLSWGQSMMARRRLSRQVVNSSLRESGRKLAHAIGSAMDIIQTSLFQAYEPSHSRSDTLCVKDIIHRKALLVHAVDRTKYNLLAESDALILREGHSTIDPLEKNHEFNNFALFMISLLQVAEEIAHGLEISEALVGSREQSRLRFWVPKFSWSWLGLPPQTVLFEGEQLAQVLSYEPQFHESDLSWWEAQEGMAEKERHSTSIRHLGTGFAQYLDPLSYGRILWSRLGVARVRVLVSRFNRAIRHSVHLRHAFKNALGAMLLAFPAFLAASSKGRQWFSHVHGQWMVISYVWVLEPTTGATWRIGFLRLLGTTIGAIYAFTMSRIVGENPYGLMVVLLIAEVPLSWLVIRTSLSPLGVVASVTLPPIILAPYISPMGTSILQLAVMRGVTIGIGIVLALLVNHVIFPRHARVVFLTQTAHLFARLSQLYIGLCRLTMQPYTTAAGRRSMLKQELRIRSFLLSRSSALVSSMESELSLMPKPIGLYRRVVSSQQHLLDILAGLRRIREHVPKDVVIHKVLDERRNFISCVCLSLLACEHAFLSRRRLPQFLPPIREALHNLVRHVDKSLHEEYKTNKEGFGFALVFAYAEHEALVEMVDEMENLLSLCRKLFGTSSWLEQGIGSEEDIDGLSTEESTLWSRESSRV